MTFTMDVYTSRVSDELLKTQGQANIKHLTLASTLNTGRSVGVTDRKCTPGSGQTRQILLRPDRRRVLGKKSEKFRSSINDDLKNFPKHISWDILVWESWIWMNVLMREVSMVAMFLFEASGWNFQQVWSLEAFQLISFSYRLETDELRSADWFTNTILGVFLSKFQHFFNYYTPFRPKTWFACFHSRLRQN
jgi:hypothetical protein